MRRWWTILLTGLLLFAMLPEAAGKGSPGKSLWPPAPGRYLRLNQKGVVNGNLLVFHRPEGIFVSVYGLDYEGDESGLISAIERGGTARLRGAGILQMSRTGAEAGLQFMIASDGDEMTEIRFPADAFYRMTVEKDAILVRSLNQTRLNRTTSLDGRYVLSKADPVVDQALAGYAVAYFGNAAMEWDFSKAKRWAFDMQPAGTHEGLGRLRPVMQVDVYFSDGEEPQGSFLVTNDLRAVYRIHPGEPLCLADETGAAG